MPHRFPCILVVEDDAGDAHLALAVLRDLCLDQHACVLSTGSDALDWLRRRGRYADRPPGNPTVVVLDVKLPGLSGMDVLAEIRTDPELRHIAVVMFSASDQERDVRQAYELGANAYVVKAIDFAAYKTKLSLLIQFWTAANEPLRK